MKKTVLNLVLIFSAFALFAQTRHALIRINERGLSPEQIHEKFAKPSDTISAIGVLTDGSAIIFNKSSMQIETTPYELTYDVLCKVMKDLESMPATYVQFNTHITKFNVQQVPQLQNTHYNYIKQLKNIGSVILEGRFFNDDGGFLVIEGIIDKAVIYSDPTLQSGFIIPEISEMTLTRFGECVE